jgi:hypothetical protein
MSETEFRPGNGNGAHRSEPAPYSFAPAMPAGHFVTEWVSYCASRTDAAHEIHELAALILLASATPRLRMELRSGTVSSNLYGLVVADSTISRKTTAKEFAKLAHCAAFTADTLCPDASSPEGFFEHMSEQPCSTLYSDEFGELLRKMQSAKFMAGFGTHLLEMYGGGNHVYRRASKRTKTKETTRDELIAADVHLNILGLTTPTTLGMLTRADIQNGLLARFAIVMPEAKPERMSYFATAAPEELRVFNGLVSTLANLRVWATAELHPVRFAQGVFDRLETLALEIEQEAISAGDSGRIMLHRLTPMAAKVAALLAAGQPNVTEAHELTITRAEADGANTIVRRWMKYALTFASRVGENDFERNVGSCLRLVRERGRVTRTEIARCVRVERRVLDGIRDALLDRAEIAVNHSQGDDGGRPFETWEACMEKTT